MGQSLPVLALNLYQRCLDGTVGVETRVALSPLAMRGANASLIKAQSEGRELKSLVLLIWF